MYSTLFVDAGHANLDITSAISNVAMTHRVLMGMNFVPDGIEFSPNVPICFDGDKKLTGFKYRNGSLDITVKGTGHDVDFIMLDGTRINGNFIGTDALQGHHTIEVTMRPGAQASQRVTIVTRAMVLPDEPQVVWNGDSALIVNYNAS